MPSDGSNVVCAISPVSAGEGAGLALLVVPREHAASAISPTAEAAIRREMSVLVFI
jgi:hypothetical protein